VGLKVTKISNYSGGIDNPKKLDAIIKDSNKDILNIVSVLNGRVRFGVGGDGDRGENIAGEFQVYTSNGSADTEDVVAHGLGSVPVGYIVIKQDKGSIVYDSGTSWTSTNIYLKQTGTSVATSLFLLK
jgi:hypothetical protein